MKILAIIGAALTLGVSRAAFAAAAVTNPRAAEIPIPRSTVWVSGFLLLVVWLFVAAIILGPLAAYFKLGQGRSAQKFADDVVHS